MFCQRYASSRQHFVLRQGIVASLPNTRRWVSSSPPTTLHPDRISPGDYVDLSGLFGPTIFGINCPYRRDPRPAPYPPDAQGFFYFRPSEYPLDPGEIRFRRTSSRNPSKFKTGKDLLRPEGYPWCIKLPSIASQKSFAPIRAHLLKEELVSEAVMQRSAQVGITRPGPFQIYTLEQPFYINFGTYPSVIMVSANGKQMTRLMYMFRDNRKRADGSTVGHPYTGSAMVRLELGKPGRTTAGGPEVLLRVLKILQPVKCVIPSYDGYVVEPRAGFIQGKMMGNAFYPAGVGMRRSKENNQVMLDLIQQAEGL
ncbi:hypothetical protein D9615_000821 [Tricholomella constricta]|uniref:Uncharacterized protein n=1 Tax=Tricholomella constricta TaxID=117010 RepID=A0A8H5HRI8_9AGAR|nr:hypothetical protein D9615_000821 [Tricholomella constricta]